MNLFVQHCAQVQTYMIQAFFNETRFMYSALCIDQDRRVDTEKEIKV